MKTKWNNLDSFDKAYYRGFAEGAFIALVIFVVTILPGFLVPLFFLFGN